MLNPAHLLEIALLLLVAFLSGAVAGALARLVVFRLIPARAPASPVAAASEPPKPEEAPALVAAPVIGELVKTPAPAAPAEVPALDFTEALLALAGDKPGSPASQIRMPSIAPLPAVAVTKPTEAMAPARVAGETTSGQVVAHPRRSAEPARISVPEVGGEVIRFPLEKLAAETPAPPVAAIAPPKSADEPAPPIAAPEASTPKPEARAEPVVVATPSVEPEVEPVAATATVETTAEVHVAAPEPIADVAPLEVPDNEVRDPFAEPAAPSASLPPEPVTTVTPEPAVAPEPSAEDDEAAAMRAIEGNWSPRRAASPRTRRAALPEVSAEAAIAESAAAVASATEAVDLATVPESDEAPGKPVGIPAPRLGVKDDLTHVIGILPILETALNRLGLYHFDQIAELSDDNVGWIESHLGIAGRIGREHWREQAQGLTPAPVGAKKAASQQ